MGEAILELKLSQDLVSIDQYPLFLVFLDLRKAYYTLDQVCIFTTLEGYGSGSHMCGILAELWERQEFVTWKNGYHGPHFQEKGGGQPREASYHLPSSI